MTAARGLDRDMTMSLLGRRPVCSFAAVTVTDRSTFEARFSLGDLSPDVHGKR
jgi:hypothetical protein